MLDFPLKIPTFCSRPQISELKTLDILVFPSILKY